MRKIFSFIFIILIAIGFIVTFDTFAMGGKADEGKMKKGILRNILVTFIPPTPAEQKNIAQKLELTEEQRSKMKELNDKYKRQSADLRKKYQQAYNDIVLLMKQEKPNKERVNRELKTFHSIHSQVLNQEVKYWMDLKTILTPSQNNKLWEIFEQNRTRR